MSDKSLILFLLTGFILFALSLSIRMRTGGKYEIKMTDLALVLIPLLVWLIGTGKIQKFAVGGVEFTTAQAFIDASNKTIEQQIALAPPPRSIEDIVEIVEPSPKVDVSEIPRLIKNKTEALEFRLGYGRYWGPAIKTYFESLDAHAFLRYAVIYYQDGSLFGVFEAKELLRYFREQGESAYHDFAKYINKSDEASLQKLKGLPGFVPGEYAVAFNANKRTTLEEMDKLKRKIIPVVDSRRRFIGIIDSSQLTTSLIIDFVKKLEGAKQCQVRYGVIATLESHSCVKAGIITDISREGFPSATLTTKLAEVILKL